MDRLGHLKLVVGRQQGDSALEVGIFEDLVGNLVQESGCPSTFTGNNNKICELYDRHSYFGFTNSRKKLVVINR